VVIHEGWSSARRRGCEQTRRRKIVDGTWLDTGPDQARASLLLCLRPGRKIRVLQPVPAFVVAELLQIQHPMGSDEGRVWRSVATGLDLRLKEIGLPRLSGKGRNAPVPSERRGDRLPIGANIVRAGRNIEHKVGIALGRSHPRAVDADARCEIVTSEASRRVDAADEYDSRLSRFKGCRRWRVFLGFHVEVGVIIPAGIVKGGGAKLVAPKAQGAEKEYCRRLFHVGISWAGLIPAVPVWLGCGKDSSPKFLGGIIRACACLHATSLQTSMVRAL